MTTSNSPIGQLRTQATLIAKSLKSFERGEKIDPQFAAKLEAAKHKPAIKVGIVMDDKVITLEIHWATIRATDEAALIEYIIKLMRGEKDN